MPISVQALLIGEWTAELTTAVYVYIKLLLINEVFLQVKCALIRKDFPVIGGWEILRGFYGTAQGMVCTEHNGKEG